MAAPMGYLTIKFNSIKFNSIGLLILLLTTITVQSDNGPGWPDNDRLDQLFRATALNVMASLNKSHYKTGHPVGELPICSSKVCGKREGWARKGKYHLGLKVCFEHSPLQYYKDLEIEIKMGY